MKKLLGFLVAGLLLTATSVMADSTKGQKLYSKKLKKSCGMSGAKMAAKHSQDEWEAIGTDGLNDAIKKECGKTTKGKYLPHLYDFFYEYANDSGNVPSC